MNATIYARISRDPDDQRLGVDRQDRRGREIAEANGWTVADVIIDNDASGTNTDRPGFTELNKRIASGDIDVVIVQDQDRIARNLRILLPFADLCAEHDVRLESWGGPLDLVTADGELVASVKGATDAHYARKLSEKSKAGHRDLAQSGRPNGGIRAFGFAENRIDHDAAEAALIVDAADRILAGDSLRSISNDWNTRGVTTPTGKPFVSVVIRRVLLNPRIVGKREVGHWEKNPATGKRRRVVDGVVDGVWEPILDQDVFDQVGEILRSPTRAISADTTTLRYWLRGVTSCGKCGHRIGTAQEGGTGRRVYRCEPAPVGCGGIKASAQSTEAVVEAAVLEYLADDRGRLTVGSDDLSDRSLAASLKDLEQREKDLGSAVARGTITVSIAEEATVEIRELRSNLESQIESNTTAAERIAALDGLPRDLESLWPEMTPKEKNRIIRLVIDRIEIGPALKRGPKFDPQRITIDWL